MSENKIRTGVPFPVTPSPECPEFDMCQFLHLAMSRKEKEAQAKDITERVEAKIGNGQPTKFLPLVTIKALEKNEGLLVDTDAEGNVWYWNDEETKPNKYVDSGVLYSQTAIANGSITPIKTTFIPLEEKVNDYLTMNVRDFSTASSAISGWCVPFIKGMYKDIITQVKARIKDTNNLECLIYDWFTDEGGYFTPKTLIAQTNKYDILENDEVLFKFDSIVDVSNKDKIYVAIRYTDAKGISMGQDSRKLANDYKDKTKPYTAYYYNNRYSGWTSTSGSAGNYDYKWWAINLYSKSFKQIVFEGEIEDKLGIEYDKTLSNQLLNSEFLKTTEKYWFYKGQPLSNENTLDFCYSDFIPVTPNQKYTFSSSSSFAKLIRYEWLDANKRYINGETSQKYISTPYTITIPEGAYFIVGSFFIKDADTIMLVKGDKAAEEYEPFIKGNIANKLYLDSSQVIGGASATQNKIEISLPKQYDLVVGDTFQLFFEGIIKAKNPLNYNIEASCSYGKVFKRFFVFTPTSKGTHNLTIKVSDDYGNVLATKTTKLVCDIAKPSPTAQTNILCVGDSLTNGGEWVNEVARRLTLTNNETNLGDAAPIGKGLTNISFVGKKKTTGNFGFEGAGGWSFKDYIEAISTREFYWITTNHDKTNNDQESIYQDSNGIKWQLETIEVGRLKFKLFEGVGILPTNGTLTWVSGGENHSNVAYTNAIKEGGNPFAYNGKIDFNAYCKELGVNSIDQCYVLLGWNDTKTPDETYKANVKQFLDNLIAFNPNIKISLMGLEIPSIDGCGNNYGGGSLFFKFEFLQNYVFKLNKLYEELANEYQAQNKNVYFIQICGQFDTANNMMVGERTVNTRNPKTEIYQTNGVHPAKYGYYQIADAVYRKINNLL